MKQFKGTKSTRGLIGTNGEWGVVIMSHDKKITYDIGFNFEVDGCERLTTGITNYHDAALIAVAPRILYSLQVMLDIAKKEGLQSKYPKEFLEGIFATNKALGE